jgi:hypothetical protein
MKKRKQLVLGTRIKMGCKEYEVVGRPYRNRDYAIMDDQGVVCRLPIRRAAELEVLP